MSTARGASVLATLTILATLGVAAPAHAATTISKAQLSGSVVLIEGAGATLNARIVVNGGWLSGRADHNGVFRIENSTFTLPANCRIRVSDGRTIATARLAGCTPYPAGATSAR